MISDFECEVRRRKNIASQARHKKNGSKSKKCSLSTDYMTHKQWTERNGEVMSYKIGSPMSWVNFKALPKDLKEEYLNNLVSKYSVNKRNLSDMFGVSSFTITRLVEKEELNVKFARGRHPNEDQLAGFNAFLSGNSQECSDGIEDVPVDVVEIPSVVEELPEECAVSDMQSTTKLNAFTMDFSGKIDVDMVANSLRYILGASRDAQLKIECMITA